MVSHNMQQLAVCYRFLIDSSWKCDGTRWRTGGEMKGKLANGVGSQYSSHYLGTWCIQHYYRWCAHLGCQQSTELTPPGRFKWTRPFRAKYEIWFLRVCHHISNAVYHHVSSVTFTTIRWVVLPLCTCERCWKWCPRVSIHAWTSPPMRHRVPSHFNWTLP